MLKESRVFSAEKTVRVKEYQFMIRGGLVGFIMGGIVAVALTSCLAVKLLPLLHL